MPSQLYLWFGSFPVSLIPVWFT